MLCCRFLFGYLLVLGVFNGYAAAQTANQVLVQIVNQVEKASKMSQ